VGTVRAQETPAPAPTPAPAASPSLLDNWYDGKTHIMVAPYLWGPTLHANFQYSIPTLKHGPPSVSESSFSVPATDYISNLNSAAMFAFDARKGDFDVFGDYIYLNASASAGATGTFTGPLGKLVVPVSINTNAHLRTSIWELAAGYTVARGHNADLSVFGGLREFPLSFNVDYTVTVGKRGIFAPTGSLTSANIAQDVIFGLRGKAFFGDSHFYVPYYADFGTGAGQVTNQTWQAYGGGGYGFNHGQQLLVLWRALNYYAFAPVSHLQRLSLGGPLIGYTFNI
jgi:hypothetical protein